VPRVDLVMVSWNDKANVTTALESVFALSEVQADPDFANVVVSDNGSTDGTVEFIRERYGARVMLIENGTNLGFGAACNRAFAQTSAPYIFLLNPDAELKNRALAAVVAFLDEHPRCGIAGSRLYNTDGSIQPSCGEFDTWTGAFLRSSAWGELPPLRRFANGASLRGFTYDRPRRVDLVIGAAVGLRRSTRSGPSTSAFFSIMRKSISRAVRRRRAGRRGSFPRVRPCTRAWAARKVSTGSSKRASKNRGASTGSSTTVTRGTLRSWPP
jgi:hypothetical protein